MLAAMGLRDWFRRHGNVFSISTREVAADSGDDDMLTEEYGDRAVEARQAPDYGNKSGLGVPWVTQLDVSEDELADGEPPPDPAP
jgi:hypothetical protein